MYLTTNPIDLAALLNEARSSDGAVCLFVGVVRNESGGRETVAIDYEAYDAMAEAEMARIEKALVREQPRVCVRIQHRVGRLAVGEASVVALATAPHREEAFAACREAIDRIKKIVPIWKKEIRPDGSGEWVDATL